MHGCRCYVTFLVLAVTWTPGHAQAPTFTPPFPMGQQRGTTRELTLTGTHLNDPTSLVASFPVTAVFPTDNKNGQDPAKLRVQMTIPANAPLGWHTIRLVTRRGISEWRVFCIDDLPEVLKAGTPNAPETAQAVPNPCVVCGRLDAEKTDYYRISAAAGQRLSFEVLGRRLGNGSDPQLRILDAKGHQPLAFADDAPGLAKDPRLVHTFKEAGDYLVEIRDVRYQGGADWFYRLRIGDFPLPNTPYPLVAARGRAISVQFAGPQVEGQARVLAPADAEHLTLWPRGIPVFPAYPEGLPGWPVSLALSDLAQILEQEPNDKPEQANPVSLPCGVNGRFEKKGDKDHYRFAVKKGTRYLIEAQTYEHGSPTSVYMTLNNAAGKEVLASNPAGDAARLDYTAAEDGDLVLMIEHLHYWGGPAETYYVTLRPYAPGFSLTCAAAQVSVHAGAYTALAITATRRDFNGPIDVVATAGPHIGGTAQIPEGQNQTVLVLHAQAASQPTPLVIRGRATINGQVVEERVRRTAETRAAMGNLPFPPPVYATDLVAAVLEPAPFTFVAEYVHGVGARGLGVPVRFTVQRQAGFEGEVAVTTVVNPAAPNQPPPVPPITLKIPPGQTTAQAELKPLANAPGQVPLAFAATVVDKGMTYVVSSTALPLALVAPIEVAVTLRGTLRHPASTAAYTPTATLATALHPHGGLALALESGLRYADGPTLVVTVQRRGGYSGPVALEATGLPPGVMGPKVVIGEGQTTAAIPLAVQRDGKLGATGNIVITGTATGAGNIKASSSGLAVRVE